MLQFSPLALEHSISQFVYWGFLCISPVVMTFLLSSKGTRLHSSGQASFFFAEGQDLSNDSSPEPSLKIPFGECVQLAVLGRSVCNKSAIGSDTSVFQLALDSAIQVMPVYHDQSCGSSLFPSLKTRSVSD